MNEPPILWRPPAPGHTVEAIGGHYTVEEEGRLTLPGASGEREILYWVASAELDSACCGTTGCLYAIVPGFLAATDPPPGPALLPRAGSGTGEEGRMHVLPIGEERLRRRIGEQLRARHPGLTQVVFPNG